MTEQLTKSVESMSLETSLVDYQHMISQALFKDEQISKIKKSREGFEQKIAHSSRTIRDFVDYIKYERSLLGIIKERMKQNNITVTSDHPLIVLVSDHMKELYTQALSIFTQNIRFWDEYIKFLQTFKNKDDTSSAFDRMLEFHSDNADVWIRAILWEYNENDNYERVKSLLVRAQQRLPDAQKLYTTGVRTVLENKCELDETEAFRRAEEIYTSSRVQKFTDAEFYIEMLEIIDQFSYARAIQQHILDDMTELCPHTEIRWHTLAQRELNGLSTKINCAVDFSGLIKMECDDATEQNATTNARNFRDMNLNLKKMKIEDLAAPRHKTNAKRIEACIKTYEDAVKDVNSAKMWQYYVNAMVELNSDLSSQTRVKQSALLNAFNGAFQFNQLSEENYFQYVEILHQLNKNDEHIEKVLQKATKAHGRSLRLWVMRMRYHIQQNNVKKVHDTFHASKDLLGRYGVEIWELELLFIKSYGNADADEEFDKFLDELAHQQYPSFDRLKADILELLATTGGMQAVQKAYVLFTKYHPICHEVHAMMTDIQSRQKHKLCKQAVKR